MAWWLQGDLQPFAHFRSGMGRSPGGSVGAAAAAAGRGKPPAGRFGLRPMAAVCRGPGQRENSSPKNVGAGDAKSPRFYAGDFLHSL